MSADKGLAGLIMAARGSQQLKCWRITVPLSGQVFLTDSEPGMVPGVIELGGNAYSEVRDAGGKIVSIMKHERLMIVGTGVVREVVATPSWWEKRDEGIV